MRNLLLAAGLVSCAALVLGCPLKKKDDGDAAASDAAVVEASAVQATDAAATPAVVNAKNSADVARFPAAETAVADDDAKIASVTFARATPKSGTVVATLSPGADVTKIAEYQNNLLVTFADPKDANTTLMGWIGKEAFTVAPIVKRDGGVSDAAAPAVDAGSSSETKKLTCPLGMVAVVLSKDPVCRKKCAKDADCKGGAAGSCANASTVAGGVARVCTVE